MPERRKILHEGELCRECETPVVRHSHRKPPRYKPGGYWFEWWFRCPSCGAFYMVEAAKRLFEQQT
jgi:ribonuclease HI